MFSSPIWSKLNEFRRRRNPVRISSLIIHKPLQFGLGIQQVATLSQAKMGISQAFK